MWIMQKMTGRVGWYVNQSHQDRPAKLLVFVRRNTAAFYAHYWDSKDCVEVDFPQDFMVDFPSSKRSDL